MPHHDPGHQAYRRYSRMTHHRNWHGDRLTSWSRLDQHARDSWRAVGVSYHDTPGHGHLIMGVPLLVRIRTLVMGLTHHHA